MLPTLEANHHNLPPHQSLLFAAAPAMPTALLLDSTARAIWATVSRGTTGRLQQHRRGDGQSKPLSISGWTASETPSAQEGGTASAHCWGPPDRQHVRVQVRRCYLL